MNARGERERERERESDGAFFLTFQFEVDNNIYYLRR